jgi:hypothetical protein
MQSHPLLTPDRTPTRPRPVTHPGSCGQRRPCWRSSCRERWADHQTVEVLINNQIVAHCHHGSYSSTTDFHFQVDYWRHGDQSGTWA